MTADTCFGDFTPASISGRFSFVNFLSQFYDDKFGRIEQSRHPGRIGQPCGNYHVSVLTFGVAR